MIELNFLPQQLRAKKKILAAMPSGRPRKIFCIILGCLLAANLLIMLITSGEKFYLNKLENKANMKLPKSAEVARVSEEIKKRGKEQSVFEGLFGKRIIWAEKLNIISNELPSGIWLKRLIVTEELFSLQGVAVSLRAEEMDLIGSFLGNLKTEQGFYADFSDLAVKSIQRRSIKVVEVVDFTIAGLFKQ